MVNNEAAENAAVYAMHIMRLEKELREWVDDCYCQHDSIKHPRGCGRCESSRVALRMPNTQEESCTATTPAT